MTTIKKPRANGTLVKTWDGDILTIKVIGAGELYFDRTKAHEANRLQAEMFGWSQRFGDKAAMDMGTAPEVKFAAIEGLIKHYESGTDVWALRSGGGQSENGLLLTALCRLRPDKSVAQIGKFLESRTKEQLAALRVRKDVVEEMNKVRLERAKAVDTGSWDEDLDKMDDGDVDGEIAELIAE